MKLTLHIGTEKTGTKTLQSWLSANRPALREQGVLYPASLGAFFHRDLSIYAMDADKPDDGFAAKNIASPEAHEAFRAKLRAGFADECEQNADAPRWVMSSEHLQSRLTTVEMVKRVRDFLGDRFEAIEVVVHLRPQIDVAVSLASTAVRVGLKVTPRWFAEKEPSSAYYNYDLLVRRWEEVFGADALLIVPFRRQPDLTGLLIERLGIDATALRPPERKNEALDWRSMALANAILTHQPDCRAEHVFMDDWPARERLEVGLEAAKQFQAVFEESNAALIERRPELAAGDLAPDWGKYQAPSNLDRLDSAAQFGEQLGYIAARLSGELMLERCARLLAECDLALAKGDAAEVRTQLERTRAVLGKTLTSAVAGPRLARLRRRIEELDAAIARDGAS
jgi:hypothetical protein